MDRAWSKIRYKSKEPTSKTSNTPINENTQIAEDAEKGQKSAKVKITVPINLNAERIAFSDGSSEVVAWSKGPESID